MALLFAAVSTSECRHGGVACLGGCKIDSQTCCRFDLHLEGERLDDGQANLMLVKVSISGADLGRCGVADRLW